MKAPLIDQSWSDEQKALYEHDMQEIWDATLAPQVWNTYHNQLDLYFSFAGDGALDVLDVGCAQGTLAMKLAEKGHRVTAVDIRQSFINYAKSRYTHGEIEFICANALELELESRYDLIFANQILEHLVYPIEFVSRLVRFLKPGGRLVMTTPNAEYIRNALPTFKELGNPACWEHRQFFPDGDEHFFAYTVTELKEIVSAAGLQDERITWFETPWISGHMKFRYLNTVLPIGFLRRMDRLIRSTPLLGKRFSHQLLATGRKSP